MILIFRFLLCVLILSGCKSEIQKGKEFYEKGEFEKALPYFEDSCLRGAEESCRVSASIYSRQKTDLAKAKALKALEIACKDGDLSSCSIASSAYFGLKLFDQAIELWTYACRGGDPLSCLNLAVEYYRGRFIPRNEKKSLEFFIKACYGGEKKACEPAIEMTKTKNQVLHQDLKKQLAS